MSSSTRTPRPFHSTRSRRERDSSYAVSVRKLASDYSGIRLAVGQVSARAVGTWEP